MFLNYSALESGEAGFTAEGKRFTRLSGRNGTKRWSEAFQRKGVRLDVNLDPSIPSFPF